eukprot:2124413-Prymnesium_polylepis.1
MTGLGVLWQSLTPNLCRETRSAVARSNARAVGSAPTSKRPGHGDVPTATSSSSARGSAGR